MQCSYAYSYRANQKVRCALLAAADASGILIMWCCPMVQVLLIKHHHAEEKGSHHRCVLNSDGETKSCACHCSNNPDQTWRSAL